MKQKKAQKESIRSRLFLYMGGDIFFGVLLGTTISDQAYFHVWWTGLI